MIWVMFVRVKVDVLHTVVRVLVEMDGVTAETIS
jgi:hypothetical protein